MTLRVGLAGRAESGEDGADRAVGRRGERSSAAVLLLLAAVGMAPSIVSVWVVETGRGDVACFGAVLSWLGKFGVAPMAVAAIEMPCVGGVFGSGRFRRAGGSGEENGEGDWTSVDVSGVLFGRACRAFASLFLSCWGRGMTSWLEQAGPVSTRRGTGLLRPDQSGLAPSTAFSTQQRIPLQPLQRPTTNDQRPPEQDIWTLFISALLLQTERLLRYAVFLGQIDSPSSN